MTLFRKESTTAPAQKPVQLTDYAKEVLRRKAAEVEELRKRQEQAKKEAEEKAKADKIKAEREAKDQAAKAKTTAPAAVKPAELTPYAKQVLERKAAEVAKLQAAGKAKTTAVTSAPAVTTAPAAVKPAELTPYAKQVLEREAAEVAKLQAAGKAKTTAVTSAPAVTTAPAAVKPAELTQRSKDILAGGTTITRPTVTGKALNKKEAIDTLKEYETQPGSYNINQFLIDNPGGIATLRTAGFDWDQLRTTAKENQGLAQTAAKKVQEEHSVLGTAKYTANMVAEMVLPGLSTVRHWNELSTWEKIIYPALDVVTLIPLVGLASKGVGAGIRAISSGAKISALGGREVVELAAKDASSSLAQAYAKREAQKALLDATLEQAKTVGSTSLKKIYVQAGKAATKDLALMDKQLVSLEKNVVKLNKIAVQAGAKQTATAKAGVIAERATERLGKAAVSRRLDVLQKAGGVGISGVTTYSTIRNWNELTPTQRAAGIAMALLPIGGFGKAKNLAENALDPSKIPAKAIVPRTVKTRASVGKVEVFNPTGDNTLRLKFSDAAQIKNADYQAARKVAQDIMDQATAGAKVAKGTLAGKEVKLRGTGFQETIGKGKHTAVSGSPTGEVFKQGTGSFGVKTNLEKYLEKVNEKISKPIEITSKKYKAVNPETGKVEMVTITTKSSPGVTIQGSEGGLYLGPGLHTRFVRQSAAGLKGGISSGVILGYESIEKLPRAVAKKALQNNQMRDAAIKYFDGAKGSGQVVQGFKKFGRVLELENVATNGTQIKRVQNLRSRLADKLKIGAGEYYTRDSQGRVELFQTYVEGGRSTPYTLKEIYTLKGNALRNSLVDMGVGLKNKLSNLGKRKASVKEVNIYTKEELIDTTFKRIDIEAKAGRIPKERVTDLKREALDEIRYTESQRPRVVEIAGKRVVGSAGVDLDYEAIRTGDDRILRGEASRTPAEIRAERLPGEIRPELTRAGREEQAREPVRETREELTRETPERPPREELKRPLREEPERPPRDDLERPARERLLREEPERTARERPPREETGREQPPREIPPRERPPRERPPREKPPKEKPPETEIVKSKEKGAERVFVQGTVAWKQGIGWWVFEPPYGQDNRSFVLSKPKGATITEDARSAVGTIQSIGGTAPIDEKFDMGIVDVYLMTPPRRPGRMAGRKAIGYKPDKDKTYGGQRTRSQKVGPYHYRSGALSRKPL